jgi:ribosomal protein L11 methyltransferase
MSWLQLLCEASKQNEQAISQFLEENGAASVTYQDAEDNPVLEPLPGETPLWDLLVITGLFSADKDLDPVIIQLQQQFPDIINARCEPLKEQQWERTWMDSFKPMQFGDNLWIYPTHYELPNDNSTQIVLDPGLAFGTGTHPTTALCLEWLDNHPPKDLNLIDYGCGSGVLAIAAIKLGARHVQATDIDPQAFTATHNNMLTNQIEDQLITTCLPENLPSTSVDVVLANILSGPLTELAPLLAQLVKPDGQIVLSGILSEQENSIIHAYTPFFSNLITTQTDNWLRVTGTRTA